MLILVSCPLFIRYLILCSSFVLYIFDEISHLYFFSLFRADLACFFHASLASLMSWPARIVSCAQTAMPPPSLSLKQRLANLQQSIQSPSSPTTPTSGPGRAFGALGAALGKRKPSFTRANSNGRCPTELTVGNVHAVDEVISRMIFQAGVDYE